MRATISLDGIWEARLDGEASFGRRLAVPMPWQAADPTLRDYAGGLWYRREFDLPPTGSATRLALRFGAVDYEARVWVNGQEVGGHVGGYTPFEVDADGRGAGRPERGRAAGRRPGRRRRDPARQAGRALVHAGLGALAVGRAAGAPAAAGSSGSGSSRTRCAGPSGCAPPASAWTGRRRSPSRSSTAGGSSPRPRPSRRRGSSRWSSWRLPSRAPGRRTTRTSTRCAPGWATTRSRSASACGPSRRATARSCSTASRSTCAARSTRPTGRTRSTRVPSDEQIEREIRLARELGLNLLRKHIKPEDPRYLDACDRLGMLIWAEPANPDRFTEAARAALRRDLLEMVERDYNRPSVIVWSLYNEDWGVPEPVRRRRAAALGRRAVRRAEAGRPDPADLRQLRLGARRHRPERLPRVLRGAGADRALPRAARLPAGRPVGELRARAPIARRADPRLGVRQLGAAPTRRSRAQRSGGEPDWFARYDEGADNPTDRMKRVAGFEARFERLGLGEVFGSPGQLCAFLQRRAARALKAQIEEMRARPRLRGYVVTELTDLEWEGNGWLDYWRQPKSFHADLAAVNAPLALIARPERRGWWAGEPDRGRAARRQRRPAGRSRGSCAGRSTGRPGRRAGGGRAGRARARGCRTRSG